MKWWQWLLGPVLGSSQPSCPTTLTHDVVPGRLRVDVWAHSIATVGGKVDCWTYVTNGMLSLGQKEFVFSLCRRANEGADQAPGDPLRFFHTVFGLAENGRKVDVGDFTVFGGPKGFLGLRGRVAIAYMPPQTLEAVKLPPPEQSLTAMLLTPEEAELLPQIGSYRVMALLGLRHRYFPHPPWNDPSRGSVLTRADFEQSLLAKVPRGRVPGATVRTWLKDSTHATAPGSDMTFAISAENISLLIPRDQHTDLSAQWKQLPGEGSIALLTNADPQARIHLVWQPDQTRCQTIGTSEGTGQCITGGFVMFIYGPSIQDGGRIFEDGFRVLFSPDSWERFCQAIEACTPFSLMCVDPKEMSFSLDWVGPTQPRQPPPKDDPAGFAVVHLLLFQPDDVLQERLPSPESLASYVNEVTSLSGDFWRSQEKAAGQELALVLAIKPGGRSRFWADFSPGGVPDRLVQDWFQILDRAPVPTVRAGPVAVNVRGRLWGGSSIAGKDLPALPEAWLKAAQGQALLVPDEILARVWPD